jgi:predicted nucleic acid-binding protein
MLVLDTNVYIDFLDNPARTDALASRLQDMEDEVAVSSVVVSELRIGLQEPKREADMMRLLIGASDPLLTPSHEDWLVAGDALRVLGGHAATKRRSFWNDAIIAASCLRVRATLVTSNAADFRRIRTVIPVETAPAWDSGVL